MLCLVTQSCLTLCDPIGYSPPGIFLHGASPDKNTGVGCHALLRRISPTQRSNPSLQLGRWVLYHWSTWEAASKCSHTVAKLVYLLFFSFCLGYLNLPEQSGCVNSSNILDLTFQLIALTVPWPLCRHDPKDVESRGITLPTGHDESLILKLFYSNGFCLLKKIKNHVSSYTIVPKLNIQNGWRCPRPPGR